jgi:hypothetical protein
VGGAAVMVVRAAGAGGAPPLHDPVDPTQAPAVANPTAAPAATQVAILVEVTAPAPPCERAPARGAAAAAGGTLSAPPAAIPARSDLFTRAES